MFDTLAAKVAHDRSMPERVWRLDVLSRVLHGTLYDVLRHDFHVEYLDSKEYVPLKDRKPSVRYNLCRIVVQDSIALLFGEGHFPAVDMIDAQSRESLALVIKESRLPQIMEEAAFVGSVGSVAVLLRVLKGRVFFTVMPTLFLTPTWQADVPDELESVTERYKVKGASLQSLGYTIPRDKVTADYWFQRTWDSDSETWFLPLLCSDTDAKPEPDTQRTVTHGLGFVPMVWIKNLPGGIGVDGACTFRAGIESQIEIEYQLSQAGRGLKYSSDPLLLLKEPSGSEGASFVRSASNAIVVDKDGDGKMLEINGTAAAAVIEYVRSLREMALESIHGNRSNADKLSAAQSGRALELLHQSLIWLADALRTSYGENGLLPLVRMIIAAGQRFPLCTRAGRLPPIDPAEQPSLRWPDWFPPTGADKLESAQSLAAELLAGIVSRETAVKLLASQNDIEDVQVELAAIVADEVAADARAKAQAAAIAATEVIPG